MGTPYRTLASLLVGLIPACRGSEDGGDSRSAEGSRVAAEFAASSEAVGRARALANGLGQDLQSRLFAALDSGGVDLAIGYCADSAQAWSQRHAIEDVYVRRVSLRVRSPGNRPDAFEERELQRLDSLQRSGVLPGEVVRRRILDTGDTVVQYMRPILVQERCLACHGRADELSPAVRELLARRYPEDRATGYAVGDLRGMLSVRVQP